MTGKLFIDGRDAYIHYGIFIQQNGYRSLVQYPSLKSPDTIDWPEEDGVEVDLTDPKLDSKEFPLYFYKVDDGHIDELIADLSAEPYHLFEFSELGYAAKLRLVSQPDKKLYRNMERFNLQFADDFPLPDYEYIPPVKTGKEYYQYDIDGKLLSDYGIYLLEGSDEEIEKSPAVKSNLLIKRQGAPGVTYLGEDVVFQTKDVGIKCFMKAPDITTFWRNYHAFLHDLTQPGERLFFSETILEQFPCYYKSSSVSKFDILRGRTVWCEFTVTLVFTSFRVGENCYLLANQDSAIFVTEDGTNFIDIKTYAT